MAPAITVLLTTLEPGTALAELVACWDDQSARGDTVELVVADLGSTDGSAERLHQLARRRQNVVVLGCAGQVPDALRKGLQAATGEHVLLLDQTQRLAPRALELLARQAARTGADVVFGRASAVDGSGSFSWPDDRESVEPSAVRGHAVAAVRRALLLGREDAVDVLADPGLLPDASQAVVGAVAVAVTPGRQVVADGLQVEDVVLRWHDGRLEVAARVALELHDDAPAPLAWLVVAAAPGWSEATVPASLREDRSSATDGHSAWHLHVYLDVATADGGEPLADGLWDLHLRLATESSEATAPLPAVPTAAAVVDGRLLALTASPTGARLDVGSTRTSVVDEARLEDATVVETAAGALLTLRYPRVHVHGTADVPARLRLDRFGLPARLICTDGAARLECFATGLSGTSVITVFTGRSRPRATGLSLDIDELGRMRVVPAAEAAAAVSTSPAAEPQHPVARPSMTSRTSTPPVHDTPSPKDAQPPRTLVQRARRRVPRVLEPAARRLSGVPVLRRAYRGLIRR